MKLTLSIAIVVFAFTASALAQNASVYTSTKTSACRTISSNPNEAGSYEGECAGVGGYKVRLIEGDIRQTINIITPAKKKFELNFWSFYSGFSAIGEKIEWRTKKGVPVALIARYNVAGADDSGKSTSYLMISKISKTESCVVDVIMPGAKQNEEARVSADAASTKPCKTQD
ncbi:MAG: hypothetical protein IPI64_07180 [Chloracidobacterium sp.]|nr:hypothetical protein [Chloracidobacterium sp.]